jgi:tetratricopeptide (TPR) repeat protein
MKKYLYLLLCLTVLLFAQCANEKKQDPTDDTALETDELGTIKIDVTGTAEAKEHFMDGLLLLHSFEYADAEAQFKKAQALDSTFVMAYWGEAMTKNHPLWRHQDTEEAQAILQKLAPDKTARIAMAQTALEKDLLQGAEILFGDGDKDDRDLLYRDHMETLQQKYPDNHEVSALYALSLLGTVKDGRDYEVYGKAATIAQGIISENNNHPGALHYLIHAYDDPQHAAKALQAANSYSRVAPDAGHALHMPSHIYVALGMWDEVIRSNIASYDASVERMKRKELDNDARGYHAFKWLMYAKLQKEQYDEALTQVKMMKQYCTEMPSPRARSHYAQMRALYLNESGRWDDPIATDTIDVSDLIVVLKAVDAFTQGNLHYHKKDKEALATTITQLEMEIKNAETDVLVKGGKMCSGVSYYNQLPNQQDIDRSKVILHQLKAMKALLANQEQKAIAEMQRAVDMEEKGSFMFGPPEVIRPSPEFYGNYLMEKGKTAEAKAMFEKAIERAPNRLIPTQALKSLTDI